MKLAHKKYICMLLAFLTAFMIGGFSLASSSASGVDDAKGEIDRLEQEKKETEKRLKELEALKGDLEKYIEELDKDLNATYAEMEKIAGQMEEKQAEIDRTKEELAGAKADEEEQYEAMKLRIRYMYENSPVSYLELLLSAESFAEVLNRAEYISQISEYDRKMLGVYEDTVEGISQKESALETELAELADLKEQNEAKQNSLETMVEAKTLEVEKTEAKIDHAAGQVLDFEDEIGEQKEIIKRIEESVEASIQASKEEASRKAEEESRRAEENGETVPETPSEGGNTNTGFIWPLPDSKRITSYYGSRVDPVTGEKGAFHSGLDVGAPTGTDIVAAAEGTVTVAGYTSINGNYIKIYHGNGITTAYCHCSVLEVEAGEKVSQGQVIAKVGSTGKSTGPHLHFGVAKDGTYVDPLGYVSP